MVSTLGNTIQFLQNFGLFDVVLPFLLVFTLVFAILEKTKIFGVEGKEGIPKKNLNAMVAFSIAFFVVAAGQIVQAIQTALPWISLLLVVIISFLLLSGVFFEDKQFSLFKEFPGATKFFIVAVLIAIILIFLYAFNLLGLVFGFFLQGGDSSTIVTSIILLLLMVAAIWFVIGGKSKEEGKKGG